MALVGFVGLCLLVAAADASLTAAGVSAWHASLAAPPGTLPMPLFRAGSLIVHLVLGTAAWVIWRHAGAQGTPKRAALRLWGWQLLFDAGWPPIFFGLHRPDAALLVMAPLLALIGLTLRAFRRLDRAAALLMLPYALWMCYAGYLTAGFFWLNPG